ncbi:MAG: Anaerobic nitric oxide reductase transcription regulator NorR [Syntrophus sp. SKADARSKE-3]|nr:Anaerobic nitric oxide reductase transcription regulator NorR [Syntrophus sp. SKADARSKE-3]
MNPNKLSGKKQDSLSALVLSEGDDAIVPESTPGALLDKDKLLQSIFRISALLTVQANLDEILAKILDELVDTIGFDQGSILLLDETKQYLKVKVVKNYSPAEAKRALATALNCYKHDCLATRVAKTGEPVTIGVRNSSDAQVTELDRILTKAADGSTICAPLKIGDDVIGVIAAWCEREINFFPEEIKLFLALTSQMSIVVHNARLFERDKDKINRLMMLQEAVSEMNLSYGRDSHILNISKQTALRIANADKVVGYVLDIAKNRYIITNGGKNIIESKEVTDQRIESSIVKKAIDTDTIVINQRGPLKDPQEEMKPVDVRDAEVAIPFRIKYKFRGAFHLVKRKGLYDQDQINVLDILIKNAATAYDNAIMHSILFREAETLKTEVEKLKEREDQLLGFHDILGRSQKMIDIFHVIADVAGHNTNILIQGASGTGKELIARAIHRHSPRHEKPLVDLNCAAIPATLLESELFGYEAGAFTDAKKRKIGLLEYATGGTILMDEIGEMPIQLQAKFLRMMEDGHIRRVGGTESIPIDVRFIFSTNRDLNEMVSQGTFREDLLYRIRVVPLHIPPLRDRSEDIILLGRYFVREFNKKFSKSINGFSKDAEQILLQYAWPGNVRELKNIIERVMILKNTGDIIVPEDLPSEIVDVAQVGVDIKEIKIESFLQQIPLEGIDYDLITGRISGHIKKRILENALAHSQGNKSEAAKRLSISRYKFIREQKKFAI